VITSTYTSSINGSMLTGRSSTANRKKIAFQFVAVFLFQEIKKKYCGLAAETLSIRVKLNEFTSGTKRISHRTGKISSTRN
jgi:hypothetical protein